MELRIIDAGTVPALRSQSLWHGIASAMQPDGRPTLSFCRPAMPYVCLGFHRRLEEIDLPACAALGLPVLRRQIGGGPVYLDADQLFFQVTVPVRRAPARVDLLYRMMLQPAVAALRRLGLPARLEGVNEIVVSDRRVSGTGAGQIGQAVTVVGNIIFRFPHRRMAEVLAFPDEEARADFLHLVRRYVSSLEDEGLAPIEPAAAQEALRSAYAQALGLQPVQDEPTGAESSAMDGWEQRFTDPEWLRGDHPPLDGARTVKVRAGVWLVIGRRDGVALTATVVSGTIESARIHAPGDPESATRIAAALVGVPAARPALVGRLARFGATGRHVQETLERALTSGDVGMARGS